ncbi:MAG: AAA family ATPase [Endomicrobiales bacterium]
MNKETLKRVIVDQRQELEKRFCQERVLEREGIKPCMKYLVQPNLLLVSGMRRAGKSFFAHILAGKNSYAFLNFDDERLMGFVASDFNNVLECFNELYGEPPYLLFDEIQNVKGWELFAGRLRNTAKVIITGSNANLLSRELSTHLTGRFMEYVLHPMSFKEFCGFKKEGSLEI